MTTESGGVQPQTEVVKKGLFGVVIDAKPAGRNPVIRKLEKDEGPAPDRALPCTLLSLATWLP